MPIKLSITTGHIQHIHTTFSRTLTTLSMPITVNNTDICGFAMLRV